MILQKSRFENIVNNAFEYSLYLILFFTPISKSLSEIFKVSLIISGSLWVLINLRMGPRIGGLCRKFKNTFVIPIILLFIAILLSLINTDFLSSSFKGAFFKWGKYILLYVLIMSFLRKNKSEKLIIINNIVTTFMFSAYVLVVDSILQLLIGIDPIRHNPLFKSSRVNATFGINNDFGGWLITLIPVFLVLALFNKSLNIAKRMHLYLLSILLFLCLVFTYARTAWIAFFISLGILIFRKNKLLIFGLVLFAIIFLLILPGNMKHDLFMANTAFARIDIWKGAWNMIKDNPITGMGINTFSANYPKYRVVKGEDYAHNCYLQMWAETGIIGFLALLNLIFFFYKSSLRFFRKVSLQNLPEIFMFGLFLSLSATLIHSFFDTNLYSLQLATTFWVTLGIYDGLR